MSYRKLSLMLLSAVALAGLLYGCGSSSKEGGGTAAGVANVGDSMCRQCHSAVLDPLTGGGIIAQYDSTSPHKDSEHANDGNGCEACHGGGAQHNGVGPIPVVNPFDGNGTRCATCHTGKYQTNAPTKFADSLHANMAIKTGAACRRCHSHEGAVLGATYGLTGPEEVLDNPVYQGAVPLQKDFSTFECGTCHEHGGGMRQVKARDAAGNIVNWNPSKSNKANDQLNLCTSCHTLKTYDGSQVLATGNVVTWGTITAQTGVVGHHDTSWYRVLATTHYNNLNNPAAGGISGYVIREKGEKPCYDCHGHEARTNTSKVNNHSSSYNSANETIYTQWAKSGHAGELLQAKIDTAGTNTNDAALVESIMTTTAPKAEPWFHYDWSATNRQACQRCHTATGASNYLNGPATYDQTKNDFSHLYDVNHKDRNGVVTGGNWSTDQKQATQREMLYCWGCHANVSGEKGGLRDPGALTFTYSNGATATYPDASSSNVCIACHAGRETGDSIKNSTGDFSNLGFINSHYLSAGGTVFGKTGYTLGGRDYSIPANDLHDKIGMGVATGNATFDAIRSNYTSGPCVACHFGSNDGSHTLSPYTQYSPTDLALNPVCVNCHSSRGAGSNAAIVWLGDDATAATFQGSTHKARYQAGLEALRVQLALKGFYFGESHPYFFTAPYNSGYTETGACTDNLPIKNWQTDGTSTFSWNGSSCVSATGTPGTAGTGPVNMGAAFNYNLLKHEPGGVAHNRRYTRRLIYDSIDQIDDGTLNYSVFTTLNGLNEVTDVYKLSAISYLVTSGTTTLNAGTSAERY